MPLSPSSSFVRRNVLTIAKVEFKVNDIKQNYSMKLGDGGEAFFVFETTEEIPEALQTSPLVSPAASPQAHPEGQQPTSTLPEPDYLDLEGKKTQSGSSAIRPILSNELRAQSDLGAITPLSRSPDDSIIGNVSSNWPGGLPVPPGRLERSASEEVLHQPSKVSYGTFNAPDVLHEQSKPHPTSSTTERSNSPPPVSPNDAFNRAVSLSKKLAVSNIPSTVTESGDLMLDMTGYKSSEEDSLRAEMIARKILGEELEGNYDIGALIGVDERGNLWIYSSEEAKDAAARKVALQNFTTGGNLTSDAVSDPGYHSDDGTEASADSLKHQRTQSDMAPGLATPPQTPPDTATAGDPNRNYAKTLRLTSDQLKKLDLKPGANSMSFSVNRATCTASMYYWSSRVPVVISDIDGTITKSVSRSSSITC
jgi:phosphatidate phosphatase LPIN